ncbi:MAG TPA: hypothetical protein VNI84_11535 [Pyrinomonadaceae bacterium]|nr:hypothetical protein [Pyrinomonadaceae bacterium]
MDGIEIFFLTGKIKTEITEINLPHRTRRRLLEYRWSLNQTWAGERFSVVGDFSPVNL